MSAAHTPGPWEIWTHRNRFIDIVADVQIIEGGKSWHGIATMNESDDVARADANLIAAAPDLYDAADMALNTLLGCCISAGGVDDRKTMLEAQAMLRAAIARATGAAQ